MHAADAANTSVLQADLYDVKISDHLCKSMADKISSVVYCSSPCTTYFLCNSQKDRNTEAMMSV